MACCYTTLCCNLFIITHSNSHQTKSSSKSRLLVTKQCISHHCCNKAESFKLVATDFHAQIFNQTKFEPRQHYHQILFSAFNIKTFGFQNKNVQTNNPFMFIPISVHSRFPSAIFCCKFAASTHADFIPKACTKTHYLSTKLTCIPNHQFFTLPKHGCLPLAIPTERIHAKKARKTENATTKSLTFA